MLGQEKDQHLYLPVQPAAASRARQHSLQDCLGDNWTMGECWDINTRYSDIRVGVVPRLTIGFEDSLDLHVINIAMRHIYMSAGITRQRLDGNVSNNGHTVQFYCVNTLRWRLSGRHGGEITGRARVSRKGKTE